MMLYLEGRSVAQARHGALGGVSILSGVCHLVTSQLRIADAASRDLWSKFCAGVPTVRSSVK